MPAEAPALFQNKQELLLCGTPGHPGSAGQQCGSAAQPRLPDSPCAGECMCCCPSASAGCRTAGPAAPEASGCGALLESAPPAPWDTGTLSIKKVKSSSSSRVGHLEMQNEWESPAACPGTAGSVGLQSSGPDLRSALCCMQVGQQPWRSFSRRAKAELVADVTLANRSTFSSSSKNCKAKGPHHMASLFTCFYKLKMPLVSAVRTDAQCCYSRVVRVTQVAEKPAMPWLSILTFPWHCVLLWCVAAHPPATAERQSGGRKPLLTGTCSPRIPKRLK